MSNGWGSIVASRAQLPSPTSLALNQKNIVAIVVRADATAICGKADHDVIETPRRQKTNISAQSGDFGDQPVNPLYQEGPWARNLKVRGVKGTSRLLPNTVLTRDNTTVYPFFQSQPRKRVRADRQGLSCDTIWDEQGFFLPVMAQKVSGIKGVKTVLSHWSRRSEINSFCLINGIAEIRLRRQRHQIVFGTRGDFQTAYKFLNHLFVDNLASSKRF